LKRLLISLALLAALAGCTYHGSPQTAVEAARVQLARRGSPDAYRCDAMPTKLNDTRFDVACGALRTQVYCSSGSTFSCCVALSGTSVWESVPGDNPMVCAEHRY